MIWELLSYKTKDFWHYQWILQEQTYLWGFIYGYLTSV